jgi:hypothetical protein
VPLEVNISCESEVSHIGCAREAGAVRQGPRGRGRMAQSTALVLRSSVAPVLEQILNLYLHFCFENTSTALIFRRRDIREAASSRQT